MLNPDSYTIEHSTPYRFGTATAAELMKEKLGPIKSVVPGYIAEGLTLLGGKPKIGKSWLLLGIAIAVATGGCALGSVPVQQADVLYLALEDNKRRLQKRLNQLAPEGTSLVRLHYELTCRHLDEGLLDDLRGWIEFVDKPRLIIIDVLNRVRPPQKGKEGLYDHDVVYLQGLQSLAAECGLAIVVVHHTRKAGADDPFDCISGSTGLTGTADATLVLARDDRGTTLYGRGRDIDEIKAAMSFDPTTGHWTAVGQADEVRRSDERSLILEALADADEPLSPKEIQLETGLNSRNAVDLLLHRMFKAGEVEKPKRGLYSIPGKIYTPGKIGKKERSRATEADAYRRARDGSDEDAPTRPSKYNGKIERSTERLQPERSSDAPLGQPHQSFCSFRSFRGLGLPSPSIPPPHPA
jgi:hypothetical protein